MAATTITRATITDDDGSGTTGTIYNSAFYGTAIYDKVDALFTAPITINQGTNDDPILTFESSDIAHGITDIAATDIWARCAKVSANNGGYQLAGFTEATIACDIRGYYTTSVTTKSTAGTGAVHISGWEKSGTSAGSCTSNSNVLCVRDSSATRFILDADGDSHQDVGTAWTNFDTFDDAALLTAVSGALSRTDDPLRDGFLSALEEHKDALIANRLVTFNEDGHHFVNWSRMSMLLVGAVRQVAQQIQATNARLDRLELTA